MLTLYLQIAVSCGYALLGVAALFAARAIGRQDQWLAWLTWLLTGLMALLHGIHKGLQNAVGTWAVVQGDGSPTMDFYLRWAPAANHGRTVLMVVFFATLIAVMLAGNRRWPHPGRFALIVYVAALGFGGLAGSRSALGDGAGHYSVVAVVDTLELLLALSVLFVGLIWDRLDRLLWATLALYTFNLALNILWMSGLAGVEFTWAPSTWHMHLYRFFIVAGMVAVAIRRFLLARQGTPVPSLLGSVSTGGMQLR